MINRIPSVPEQKWQFLEQLVSRLSRLDDMTAIVLGGSYASGKQHDASDLDIGLYYEEAKPFSIGEIRRIAEGISINGTATVTEFYEWGAWVNGGAWIHTLQGKVDFLYRNLDQVQRTLKEAHEGVGYRDFDQQPPYGFWSVIYLAETQTCIPLYDPKQVIDGLKRQVERYPLLLKSKIVSERLWGSEFTLMHARTFAEQGDIYNTAGCLSRVASDLTQALFALNERYFLSDKKVMEGVAAFPLLPIEYCKNISQILARPGASRRELTETVNRLEQVWHRVVLLAGDLYHAKFRA